MFYCVLCVVGLFLGGCSVVKSPISTLPKENLSAQSPSSASNATPPPSFVPLPREVDHWPCSGGSQDHNAPHVSLKGPLRPLWTAPYGSGTHVVLVPPVASKTHIYTLNSAGMVGAFCQKTGQQKWRTSILSPSQNAPIIAGGLGYHEGYLYATSPFGEVLALEEKTGRICWRQNISLPVRSGPLLFDGKVYVMTSANTLEVMSQKSGKFLWSHQGLPSSASTIHVSGRPILGAHDTSGTRTLIVPYLSGEVWALRQEKGREGGPEALWSFDVFNQTEPPMTSLETSFGAPCENGPLFPTIDGTSFVYIATPSHLVCLSLRSGKKMWSVAEKGCSHPVVLGKVLFSTSKRSVVCRDKKSGKLLWQTPLPGAFSKNLASLPWQGPLIACDKLYISGPKTLLVLDGTTGKQEALYPLPQDSLVDPIAVNNRLYVLTSDEKIHAFQGLSSR